MNFIAVRGVGDPNDDGGVYKAPIGLLYGVAFAIKMSKLGDHRIDGYFDYVVPPPEGFWRQDGTGGIDFPRKSDFRRVSVIRLPEFVTETEFEWAVSEAEKKKKADFSSIEFLTVDEGLCVQIMHVGCYDDEPESIAKMDEFLATNGYENGFSDFRLHHEIYLPDAGKVPHDRPKTEIRHPIRIRGSLS